MIRPAQRAKIRRPYYGEHWKLGTIAAQLGLHRETVRAAVECESVGVRRGVWTGQREAWRRFLHGSVSPVARLVEAELSAKLDTPDLRLDFGPANGVTVTRSRERYGCESLS